MKNLSMRHKLLGADTSNVTGTPWFVGDLRQLTISIQTSTASASRFTFVGTNDDGFQAALGTPSMLVPNANWSIVTVLTNQGLVVFDPAPGFRWINGFRPDYGVSATSNVTVTLAGRT